MCHSRGVYVACTRTYSGQGARKKIRPHTYIRAGSRTPSRAYVRPGLVYMAGSERRNYIVVVFMGRQRNASCSWGGNGMRRVHRGATERVGANRLGRNGMRRRVHREGLDGTSDGNEAWRTAERRKRPCVRPATFETRSCSSRGVWRTAKQRKRTCVGALRSKRGSC